MENIYYTHGLTFWDFIPWLAPTPEIASLAWQADAAFLVMVLSFLCVLVSGWMIVEDMILWRKK